MMMKKRMKMKGLKVHLILQGVSWGFDEWKGVVGTLYRKKERKREGAQERRQAVAVRS